MIDTKLLEQKELEILESGNWGTISPYSKSAGKALADYVGAQNGLLCHSYDAAYEAILRSFQIAHGDMVITGEVSTPMNSIVALCAGASPLFAPVCDTCGMIRPEALEQLLNTHDNICCVVLDYLPEKAEQYPLDRVSALCKDAKVPFVINAGGLFSATYQGNPLSDYADAVLYSLEEGSEVYAGKGGLAVANDPAGYSNIYAYHNCGRPFNVGSSLNMDQLIGGDLRVTEFTAVIAQLIIENKAFSTPTPRKLVHMASQPVFAAK